MDLIILTALLQHQGAQPRGEAQRQTADVEKKTSEETVHSEP